MIFTKKKSKAVNSIKAEADGKYSYIGPHYEFVGDSKAYGAFRARLLILSIGIAVLWLLGGFIPAPGMLNCFYVIIPYFILLLVSGASALWAAFRLIAAGDMVRDYVYSSTVESIPGRAAVTAAMAATALIAEIVYLIINGFEKNVLFAVAEIVVILVIAASAIALNKLVKASEWKKVSQSRCKD